MKKAIKVILVLMWMGLIFYFSHQDASDSSNLSNGFIATIYTFLTGKEATLEVLEKYSFFTRKLAHFSVYFILGLLVLNCFFEFKLKNIIFYSFIVCVLYAISDEIHQIFIPGRAGQIRDVLIDSSGSLLGILGYYYLKRFIIGKKNIKERTI